jgi:hypothetical protein
MNKGWFVVLDEIIAWNAFEIIKFNNKSSRQMPFINLKHVFFKSILS